MNYMSCLLHRVRLPQHSDRVSVANLWQKILFKENFNGRRCVGGSQNRLVTYRVLYATLLKCYLH